jgi:hypothetical protein
MDNRLGLFAPCQALNRSIHDFIYIIINNLIYLQISVDRCPALVRAKCHDSIAHDLRSNLLGRTIPLSSQKSFSSFELTSNIIYEPGISGHEGSQSLYGKAWPSELVQEP